MNAEDKHVPLSPSLLAPRDAAVVNGEEVTFVWEPVEDAETYRLQVASTSRFDDPLFDETVGEETAVTVGNHFPTDGQTFFWRVLAGSDDEWSQEATVESFIASTEEEADPAYAVEEGPVTELARAKRQESPGSVFELEDRFEREKERGVAYEGVAAGQIIGISAAIIAVILVAVVIILGWFGQVRQETQAEAAQSRTYEEIWEAEAQNEQQLQQYGVVEEGRYHIPIDRAMDLVITEEYRQQQQQSE